MIIIPRTRAHLPKEDEPLEKFVGKIPLPTPKEMFQKLSELGYKGQEEARRAVCLMAYRHIKRLKSIYVKGVAREKLPPKANYILMGPTGCGKTFLIELLFRNILKLPTLIIDITGFTETGYVGRDPITILTSLILEADLNVKKASIGIICLDEFDKLASAQSTARFEGAGTTKDVSGYGVQKELLKILTPGIVNVPLDIYNIYSSQYVKMYTDDITIIACGAFSGFKGMLYSEKPRIGFREQIDAPDDIAYKFEEEEINNINNFSSYGFLPELIARFSRVIPFKPLDRKTLKDILKDNVIERYIAEFQTEKISLKISENVLDFVVEKAIERRTGARGLEGEFIKIIEDVAFEQFGQGAGELTLSIKDNKVFHRFKKSCKR